eukprot:COSAG02_NODE_556_length_20390_cov_88.575230_2_plen_1290_part_00
MVVAAALSLLLLCDVMCLSSRAQGVDNIAQAPSRSAANATTGNAVGHQGSGARGDAGNYLCEDWGAAWRTPCEIHNAEQLADGASHWPPADSHILTCAEMHCAHHAGTPPRDGWKPKWDSPQRGAIFPIMAWWPPTFGQLDAYAAAGFTIVDVQNALSGQNLTSFEAVLDFMQHTLEPRLQALGLLASYGGGEKDLRTGWLGDQPALWGNASGGRVRGNFMEAAEPGGGFQAGRGDYLSLPEVQYLVGQYRARNLSSMAMLFMHDDEMDILQEQHDVAQWLRANEPSLVANVNEVIPAGAPAALYQHQYFIQMNEVYEISQGGKGDTAPAVPQGNPVAMARKQAGAFWTLLQNAQKYDLENWPLINVGDGGSTCCVRSGSLVRFEGYAALAYGITGFAWYCWGHGMWNLTSDQPSPSYEFVKDINLDAQAWASVLRKSDNVGILSSGWDLSAQGAVNVSEASIIVEMSEDLLVGVFTPKTSGGTPECHLLVVDKRVGNYTEDTPPRNVSLRLSSKIAGVRPVKLGRHQKLRYTISGRDVSLELSGGQGALLRVSGSQLSSALELKPWTFRTDAAMPKKEQTNFPPDSFNALKPVEAQPERLHQGRTNTDLDPKFYYSPYQTNFILGGSHDHGPMDTDTDGERWANAGFNFVSVPLPTAGAAEELQSFAVSLDVAKKRGMFVAVEGKGDILDTGSMLGINHAYGCHPNLGGHVLGRGLNASNVPGVCATAAALRQDRGYLLPFAMADEVSTMSALASGGVPVASVLVPPPASASSDNATVRAAATISAYASVAARVNASSDLTFIASVDYCSGGSDSLLRFASYASLAYGARGLWHAGVGGCLKSDASDGGGDDMFEMVSSINRRIAHWGDLLLSCGPNHEMGWPASCVSQDSYVVTERLSSGWPADLPSRSPAGGMVVSIDTDDVLVAVLEKQHYRKTSFGLQKAKSRAKTGVEKPLLYVVDTRVGDTLGQMPNRVVRIVLNASVLATAPLESSCEDGFCECNKVVTGSVVELVLPGGAGQLVAVTVNDKTWYDPADPHRQHSISSGISSDVGARMAAAKMTNSTIPSDRHNYLCKSWTEDWGLPCVNPKSYWQPKWEGEFPIIAWWPPTPDQFRPYSDAGFNIAFTREEWSTPNASWTKMMDDYANTGQAAAELGIWAVFNGGKAGRRGLCGVSEPCVIGNATGGLTRGSPFGAQISGGGWDPLKHGAMYLTEPEVRWFIQQMKTRNMSNFASVFLHDDEMDVLEEHIQVAEYLKQAAPDIIPYVIPLLLSLSWLPRRTQLSTVHWSL